jgi:molecular chaperone GrpE
MTDPKEPTAEELADLEIEESAAIAEAILGEEGAKLLVAITTERDEYLDQLQRSRAEFANYRRRTEQERQQVRETAARDLLVKIVAVLDDMQRAYGSIPADQVESAWAQGIAHIMRKFVTVLEQAGVAPIKALGEVFDPTCHEAVASEPNSAGTHVIEVYQTGYRLGGTLLRPAMVRVGNAPPAA